MLDFLIVTSKTDRKGTKIYPKFIIKKSKDLMIKGGKFYAIYDEATGLWSTDEFKATELIDKDISEVVENYKATHNGIGPDDVGFAWDSDSGVIDKWKRFCEKQTSDNYKKLNNTILFKGTAPSRENYATHILDYPLEEGPHKSWDTLISTLYSPEERHKIEWAIGAIVTGASKTIQKFCVFYGSGGSGKSTVLKIIAEMFDGYCASFNAKNLTSSNNQFALETFGKDPLVAIQQDGNLSRIEDNTLLNSLVSHEAMSVNEKYKTPYESKFDSFLLLGSNNPVKITEAKSGLLRRLIDIHPTGNKIPFDEYQKLIKKIKFEHSGIAYHCKQVYEEDPEYYENYVPSGMLSATNNFYNYILDNFNVFAEHDEITLNAAWLLYKEWAEDALIQFKMEKKTFKEELKNYFKNYEDSGTDYTGKTVRSLYSGFKFSMKEPKAKQPKKNDILTFGPYQSIFDKLYPDLPAQYANDDGLPTTKWDKVTTTLADLDTNKLHYVRPPENMIIIDFDLKNEKGEKDFELNCKAASEWPVTYAELSKSGAGIHLHYIYDGDVNELAPIFNGNKDIEIKRFTGKASLRRMVTLCTATAIAKLTSGLPLKEKKGDPMVNFTQIKSEKSLRSLIRRNLNKEIHPGTKPSMDFIKKILDDAYNSGLHYDLSDMKTEIFTFAAMSSNHAEYCMSLVDELRLQSKDILEAQESPNHEDYETDEIVFYDVEVFPNLFLINWKKEGASDVVRMINPSAEEVKELCKFKLVGFNCRRYDNHMLYARMMGYSNEMLYDLSQRIINKDKTAFFGDAYNLSYTDIYDYCADKRSLKKWEIKLGIHHQELGLPWDQPVAKEKWSQVAEYCDNDVISTEAVWEATQNDFLAREILASITGMTVNDTTNSLTTRLIFGRDKNPQQYFNYRNMGIPPTPEQQKAAGYNGYFCYKDYLKDPKSCVGKMPYFPGYKYEFGKSSYRDVEKIGEGGRVYANPGMYGKAQTEDIASQHPHSILAENLFGKYTQNFADLVETRVAIKHGNYEKARTMFGGKLAPYLKDESGAKKLSKALKIAINSVYGLTSAKFANPFRDPRNQDNIVAKRGALFMIDLQHAVEDQGYKVIHIKTDSIKVANPDEHILKFIRDMGTAYGYTFETEAKWDRICLVNDAVLVGHNEEGWEAVGPEFGRPPVFKLLNMIPMTTTAGYWDKPDLEFKDLFETKEVKKGSIYIDMNETLPDVNEFVKEKAKQTKAYKDAGVTEYDLDTSKLDAEIAKGHDYRFVGRVGAFVPIKPGAGGGELYREDDGKYYALAGTKGLRWLEAEVVKNLGKEDDIDMDYYENMAEDAKKSLEEFGPADIFLNGTNEECAKLYIA